MFSKLSIKTLEQSEQSVGDILQKRFSENHRKAPVSECLF